MQFLYNEIAGMENINIINEDYRYLFKARRHKIDDIVMMRNLKDDLIYSYKIVNVFKKDALLKLCDKKELIVKAKRYLHIGWCIIDPKTIEKILPMLNEIGVSRISFIYCDRSQKNFVINLKRIKRILINSSQQCGRSVMMDIEEVECIENFLEMYPNSAILNFGGENIHKALSFSTIIVGCEGGFSENEIKLFTNKAIYKLNTPMILKSESAAISVSSIMLL